ncbi:MAG: substrate-binding domain-containing protein [Firmicutes bacterium]|nr:substrate-binding domain-containing protein [Bacillota bacterium]
MNTQNIGKPKKSLPTIGLLVDWLHNQYKLDFLNGAGDFARENNLNLLCFEGGCIGSSREYESQRTVLFDLVDPVNVDGLIIMSACIGHFTNYEAIRDFCNHYRPLPIVSVGMEIENIPSILTDNKVGFRDLLNHLITGHGFSRLAFISGPAENQDAFERYAIYLDTLQENHLVYDSTLMVQGDFTPQSGADAVKTLLDYRKARFEVIVAASDDMALGALDELNARGIKVPEEVAVAGFDDLAVGGFASPPLTTVKQPFYEQGRRAAELVWEQIRGREVPHRVKFPTKLVLRDSCGCFSEITSNAAKKGAPPKNTADSALYQRREAILTEIINNIPYPSDNFAESIYPPLIEQIVLAFIHEMENGTRNGFLTVFSKILRNNTGNGMNLSFWQEILSEIRCACLPYLTEPSLLTRAEDLWHQARILVAEMAILSEKRRIQKSLENNQVLDLIREELLVTMDMNQLFEVLAKRLPETGIKASYLSMFTEDQSNHQNSKLILAFDQRGPVPGVEQNPIFPSRQLIPAGILPDDRQYIMIVVSLNFAQTQFGFVLFEIDLKDVHICNALRRILCSALQGVTLFNQVQEQEKYMVAEQEHLKNEIQLKKVIEGFIQSIALTVETRDPYTAGHQFRVAELTSAIGIEMGLSKNQIEGLRMASLVHDLGKIYVPVDILNKPGRLRDIEFNLIKIHPEIAYEILKSFEFPWPLAQTILQHHERLDGSGYPLGLKGPDIIFEAKILAVADVLEAMASHRPYRPAIGIEAGLREITNNRGILYEPEVVDTCLKLFGDRGYKLTDQSVLYR